MLGRPYLAPGQRPAGLCLPMSLGPPLAGESSPRPAFDCPPAGASSLKPGQTCPSISTKRTSTPAARPGRAEIRSARSVGQGPGEAEPGQHAVVEPRDAADPLAGQGDDLQPRRAGDAGVG